MAALTDFAENLLLQWLFTTDSVTRPSTWHVALHTGDPGEDSPAENEVDTGDDSAYARQTITMGTPVAGSGSSLSTTAVTWTVGTSSGFTVTHASIFDAATGGNCLMKGALLVPRVMAASGVITFNIGEIIAILD